MKSIKTTVVLTVVAITILIFVIQTGIGIVRFNEITIRNLEAKLSLQAEKDAKELDVKLNEVGQLARMLAINIENTKNYGVESTTPIIKAYLKENNLAFGSGYWLEPSIYDAGKKYYGPYIYKDQDNLTLTWDYSNDEYNYFSYDWYKRALEANGEIVWSEPYYDPVLDLAMITSSSLIKKNDTKLGVTTVDIGLKEFENYVSNIKVGQQGYAFIITGDGYYLAHRDKEKNLKAKIIEEENTDLRKLGTEIVNSNKTGLAEVGINKLDYYTSFVPVGNTGMKLVFIIPKSEVTKPVKDYFVSTSFSLILSILIFSIILFFFISKKITEPLNLVMLEAQKMAEGNLSISNQEALNKLSSRKNELGYLALAFNSMADKMSNMVSEILTKARLVADSATHMKSIAQQTSASSCETAATMNDIANLVEEVGVSVQKISNASENNSEQAQKGDQTINLVSQQMKDIAVSTTEASELVKALQTNAEDINQITELITQIAEQTNLLALNATIEAARAGEHGLGFAVVADEVRKLAEQTTNATNNISSITKSIQSESRKVGKSIVDSLEKVKVGNKVVQDVGENFKEIRQAINSLTEQIEQIVETTFKMTTGIENIAGLTQEQSAATEEVSGTAEQFAMLSNELNDLVKKFKIKELN